MTTITELAKRLVGSEDERLIASGDLAAILRHPGVARQLARRLAEAAREIAPGREWSVEDLRDLLEAAVAGAAPDEARKLEGRQFRKRLRDHCALTQRYGDPFACVVVRLMPEKDAGVYAGVLDSVAERLRRTDMLFVYRRRFALILPRMQPSALTMTVDRVRRLVATGAGWDAVEEIHALVYPDPRFPDTQDVLDWAEDHLRD
jgi:hypothetical protein